MKSSRQSPFLTALFHPANLAMLAVIAAASLCAAWWLLPLGLVLYLLMFLLVSRNPSLRFANKVASREQMAQRFQSKFDRVQTAQLTLYNNITSGSNRKARNALKPLLHAVTRIAEQSYHLSRRMTALENHLIVSRTYRDPEAELKQMNEKMAAAPDPAVQKDFEDALRTLETQVATMRSISDLLTRFEAQLSSLAYTLEGCITSTVRLQAAENVGLQQEVENLLKSIQDQTRQLDEFKEQVSGMKII